MTQIRHWIRSYRLGLLAGVAGLLTACASSESEKPPQEESPKSGAELYRSGVIHHPGPASDGCEPRNKIIRHLVIHHTGAPLPSSLTMLQGKDPERSVGVHYVVSDEPAPRVIDMVPESYAAYHAGKSAWLESDGLNHSSIGIAINYFYRIFI